MSSPPTFTVITANRNSGGKLAATAASVLAQGEDAEYLVVDGASTDRSRELLDSLAREHPARVSILSEPDLGIYDAMNKGVARARGRYLYFLGAGDRMRPHVLTRIKTSLPEHDRGFVYGNALLYGTEYDGPFTARKLCSRNISHQAIFYGREVFRLCGGYHLRYPVYADWDLNLRCFGDRRIVKQYVPLLVAEFDGDGTSTPGDPRFLREQSRIIRRSLGFRQGLLWDLRQWLAAQRRWWQTPRQTRATPPDFFR